MAHCPPELLTDLAAVLAEVRTWPGVSEKRPGIFYLRRQPFLHFHLLPGPRRRADVKGQRGWVQVELAQVMTDRSRRTLGRELRRRYDERVRSENARRAVVARAARVIPYPPLSPRQRRRRTRHAVREHHHLRGASEGAQG